MNNTNQPPQQIEIEEHSAKIKSIKIELFDFGYYHGPSDYTAPDEHFIGREALKDKIEALLIEDEHPTGIYLVTGYRGMGKTSLIQEVIRKVTSLGKYGKSLVRLARLCFFLILFALLPLSFKELTSPFSFVWGMPLPRSLFVYCLFIPATLAYLVLWFNSSSRNNLKFFFTQKNLSIQDRFVIFCCRIWSVFRLRNVRKTKFIYKNFLEDYLLLFWIEIIFFFFTIPFESEELTILGRYFLYICAVLLLSFWHVLIHTLNISQWFYQHYYKRIGIAIDLKTVTDERKWWQKILPFLKKVFWHEFLKKGISTFKYVFSNSRRIIVPINLGQEKLTEKQILQQVLTALIQEYSRKFAPFSMTTFRISTWAYAFITYFLIFYIYQHETINNLNIHISEKYLEPYLPSQILLHHEPKYNKVIQQLYKGKNQVGSRISYPSFIKIVDSINKNNNRNNNRYEQYDLININNNRKIYKQVDSINNNKKIYEQGETLLAYTDYMLNCLYVKVVCVPHDLFGTDIADCILSPLIDYLLAFYVMVGFLLLSLMQRYAPFFPTHNNALRRMRLLKERLQAAMKTENTKSVESSISNLTKLMGFKTTFSKKENWEYPLLSDGKDLEKHMLEILRYVNEIPAFMIRPEFLFIFDELDKIGQSEDTLLHQKEEETSTASRFSLERVRNRQKMIGSILSNMKFFLSNAKAKFIFIAGREMYDAYLADVSDREINISSIFNKVIYVNSFLTDGVGVTLDARHSDITSIVEEYVCQFLFPPFYLKGVGKSARNLANYNLYLEKMLATQENYNKEVAQLKRQKIILSLKQFINYLAYRSNGAPKKVARLFEEYIKKLEYNKKNPNDDLIIGLNSENLYLGFGYYDQYTFGMVSTLTAPFMLSVAPYLKHFGDKLLVSSSFLIDHLYKFHSFAFSKRNLELTPEIIDINRAPELRDFMDNILRFLANSHLQEIVSGLHEYKFNFRVAAEINYLCKVREQESAAFNFTLDESLAIKRHYYQKLADALKTQKDSKNYIHSVGILQMVLGDLHYYDEEYDDAVLYYRDAIQYLKQDFETEQSTYNYFNFVLLLRNMLKLGHTFEQKGNWDSAFMVYGELNTIVVRVRSISTKNWGYDEYWAKLADIPPQYHAELERIKQEQEEDLWLYPQMEQEDEVFPVLVRLSADELKNRANDKEGIFISKNQIYKGGGETGEIIGLQYLYASMVHALPRTSVLEQLHHKLTVFEGIRLVYQPLIAQLHTIEKGNLGGVTINDVKRTLYEFDFVTKTLQRKEKFLIQAEFYNKIGDLLFFKNGFLSHNFTNKIPKKEENLPENPVKKPQEQIPHKIYCHHNNSKCIKNDSLTPTGFPVGIHEYDKNFTQTEQVIDFSAPCSACHFYMKSLEKVCTPLLDVKKTNEQGDNFFEKENKLLSVQMLAFIMHPYWGENSALSRDSYIHTVAEGLSDSGDTFLSCSSKKHKIRPEFLRLLLNCIEETDAPNNFEEKYEMQNGHKYLLHNYIIKDSMTKLEECLLHYYLAAWMFLHSTRVRRYAFMLTRMLYVLNEYIGEDEEKKEEMCNNGICNLLENKFIPRILRGIYKAYNNANRVEIEKYQEIFNEKFEELPLSLTQMSISNETQEVIILYQKIKMQLEKSPKIYLKIGGQLNPYSSINTKLNRVSELKLKIYQNYSAWKALGFDKWKSISALKENGKGLIEVLQGKILSEENPCFKAYCPQAIMEFLIYDTIFCLNEVIKTYQIYGISYFSNHSYLGFAHKYLAEWCELRKVYEAELASFWSLKTALSDKQNDVLLKANLSSKKRAKLKAYIENADLFKTKETLFGEKTFQDLALTSEMQVSLEALLKEEIFMNLTTRLNNKKVKDFLFEAKLADAKLSELKIYIEKVDLFKTIEQFLAEKSFQELGFTKEMQELFVTLLLEKIANKKRFLEKLELTKQVKKSQIEEKLTSLVGDIDGKSLKPGYHQEMSLQHLYSALETHKQGRAYRQMLDNMRYLDDDYNDSILHFGAALERYMINIGKIRKAIYEVRSSLKGNESALYKAENYMPT